MITKTKVQGLDFSARLFFKCRAVTASISLALLFSFYTKGGVIITTLASFNGTNGGFPQTYGDALTFAPDGSIYGTTSSGGVSNHGTIFRIDLGGALTTLYSFTGGTDGALPLAGLTLGTDGNFYGTTHGGSTNGTVFQISTNGLFTTLTTFNSTNGANPTGGLIQSRDGSFYGMTFRGGLSNSGTIFQLNTNGQLTTLFSFSGTNGAGPTGPLLQDTDGNFYGTTAYGGIGVGSIFSGANSGYGTAFSLNTNNVLNTLVFFNGTNGDNPYSGLIKGKDGNFYGTTAYGGSNFASAVKSGLGTIFQITSNGTFSTLAFITNTANYGLYEGLLEGPDGNFYGVRGGGQFGSGEFFRVSKYGTYTSLLNLSSFFVFTNSTDYYLNGSAPFGRLTQGADGNFYGTTESGGVYGSWSVAKGTVFRLSVPLQPAFQTIAKTNGMIALTWSAVAGQAYQMQYATNLFQPDWNNLGSNFIATNGTVTTFDPVGIEPNRFYRINLSP
jgi:uncharacterized repeat protein (TIGR03803 family)